MINEAPRCDTPEQKLDLLAAACLSAYEFLESYCTCGGAKSVVAKELRRALQAAAGITVSSEVPRGTSG